MDGRTSVLEDRRQDVPDNQDINIRPDDGDRGGRYYDDDRHYYRRDDRPWRGGPPWWSDILNTIVWTFCALVIIGFIVWGVLFVFGHVVTSFPVH